MKNGSRVAALVLATIANNSAAVHAATVTVVSGGSYGFTSVLGAGQYRRLINPTSAGTSDSVISNGQSSTTGYTLNDNTFRVDVTHGRDGIQNHQSGSDGEIYFTITPDAPNGTLGYVASGKYSEHDSGGHASFMELTNFLYDATDGRYLFESQQFSQNTNNESFTLGGNGGDSYSERVGNLTGRLIAGHYYRWNYSAQIDALIIADSGATASGFAQLSFFDSSVLNSNAVAPLPTAAISGLTLLGRLSLSRWRIQA